MQKICCCLRPDSSDEESIITIDKESLISSFSVPIRHASNNYAANKIYLLGSNFKYISYFKHIIIEPKINFETKSRNSVKSKRLSRIEPSVISKSDEGTRIADNGLENVINERISKKICKMILERLKINACLVFFTGESPFCLKLVKYCDVVAVEENSFISETLKNSLKNYEGTHKIQVFEGNVMDFCPEIKPDAVVLKVNFAISKDEELIVFEHLPELIFSIEKCLEFSENLVLIFPSNLNPESFASILENLKIEPCVEFLMVFQNGVLKNIAVMLGGLPKVPKNDVLNIILSKLGLNYKQKHVLNKIIEKVSLRRVLQIISDLEKDFKSVVTIEKLETTSSKFFEIINQENENLLTDIMIFYNGKEGFDIIKLLKQNNEYFISYSVEEESKLVHNGLEIIGKENIISYLSKIKRSDSSNSSSLMNLID